MAHSDNLAQGFSKPHGFSILPELLRFPAEDNGKSLADAARRDLESALQLLAERAQYLMGASGAAIALCDGDDMICRASAGPSAPPVESQMQIDSGLTAESIRMRQVLRCGDTAEDRRVDQASCRSLGIKSVMVTPLLREQRPIGVFELLAERPHAFEDRDVTVLERLSGMVVTALDHADIVRRKEAMAEESLATIDEPSQEESSEPFEDSASQISPADLSVEVVLINKCSGCSFPVSSSRTICLDCEKAARSKTEVAQSAEEAIDEVPSLFAQDSTEGKQSWLASSFAILAMMTTVLAIVWLVFKLH